MNIDTADLLERLRAEPNHPLAASALALIERQQLLMDKAASLLVEACESEDGVDTAQAEACIGAIRGAFNDVGKTTAENYLDQLFTRIGAAAGLPPHTEFNPLAVLDQMRAVIAVQGRNGAYLEWALDRLWHIGPDMCRLQVSSVGSRNHRYRVFPRHTQWNQALDCVMSEEAAAAAGAATPAAAPA
jgi:hypothetical protein